jgi:hypothetical protein
MSNAFCGGVGCSWQEVCGAVSAGLMLIGERYGRKTARDDDAASLAAAAAYRQRFLDRFGDTKCESIRVSGRSCNWVVEDASHLLLDVLETDWLAVAKTRKE